MNTHFPYEIIYKNHYEYSPVMFRTIDNNGIIIACNKSYASELGFSKEEVIGSSIFDHVHCSSIPAMKDSFDTWKKTGSVTNREVIMKRKDGSTFPALINASNLYDENKNLLGSNSVIRDISDMENARELISELKLQKMTILGELTARIAHDFKNPINVIKNSIELMESKKLVSKEASDYVNMMTRAVNRMAHQVNEVMEYVRSPELALRLYSVSDIISNTVNRITIPSDVKMSLPDNDVKVLCDPDKLEIVFVNLILNAIQAMQNRGKIDIRIIENISYVDVEIRDTGPGIPKNLLPKIFDPLFTTRLIGTGLGLPASDVIMRKHGGSIQVKSTSELGTVFVVRLLKSK
ncbi:MAG TPA: ATP-binding protein [Candidatus Nitrosotalea sp.]|nr:ATP-binding protein [Candidatus Nitrosotalea sp.]